jgi:hypothetical protein
MTPADIEIDEALGDPTLLGAALGEVGTWSTWLAILRAAFGLPLCLAQRQTFAAVAGDRIPPGRRVRELWAVAGRRSGKSRMAAGICAFLALWADRGRLAAGEVGYVLCLSASRAQAALVHQYALAFIEASPVLRQEIVGVTSDEIELRGNVRIAILSSNFKTIRGRTVLGCVADVIAFWRSEDSAQPDVEVYRAILPAMSTTSGMMVAISSPYSQRGLLFEKVRQTFGSPDRDVQSDHRSVDHRGGEAGRS